MRFIAFLLSAVLLAGCSAPDPARDQDVQDPDGAPGEDQGGEAEARNEVEFPWSTKREGSAVGVASTSPAPPELCGSDGWMGAGMFSFPAEIDVPAGTKQVNLTATWSPPEANVCLYVTTPTESLAYTNGPLDLLNDRIDVDLSDVEHGEWHVSMIATGVSYIEYEIELEGTE